MFIKRTSDAIEGISLSLINGTVSVMYNNGSVYRYTNVSRRAIANLMLNPNMSLGFWVNANCKTKRVSYKQLYTAIPTANGWAS